jgi:hypothetical protein
MAVSIVVQAGRAGFRDDGNAQQMTDQPTDTVDQHEVQRHARAVFSEFKAAIRALDQSDTSALHDLHDLLEVEIMIEHTDRDRKQLLRALKAYCGKRVHDREVPSAGRLQGALSSWLRLLLQRARNALGE